MGATPNRPRPKPTLICHISITLNLDSNLTYNFYLAINAQASGMLK